MASAAHDHALGASTRREVVSTPIANITQTRAIDHGRLSTTAAMSTAARPSWAMARTRGDEDWSLEAVARDPVRAPAPRRAAGPGRGRRASPGRCSPGHRRARRASGPRRRAVGLRAPCVFRGSSVSFYSNVLVDRCRRRSGHGKRHPEVRRRSRWCLRLHGLERLQQARPAVRPRCASGCSRPPRRSGMPGPTRPPAACGPSGRGRSGWSSPSGSATRSPTPTRSACSPGWPRWPSSSRPGCC